MGLADVAGIFGTSTSIAQISPWPSSRHTTLTAASGRVGRLRMWSGDTRESGGDVEQSSVYLYPGKEIRWKSSNNKENTTIAPDLQHESMWFASDISQIGDRFQRDTRAFSRSRQPLRCATSSATMLIAISGTVREAMFKPIGA